MKKFFAPPLSLMTPGIGLKRWGLLCLAGLIITALGVAFLTQVGVADKMLSLARSVTLSGLPDAARGTIFIALGALVVIVSWINFQNRLAWFYSLTDGKSIGSESISNLILKESLSKGPKVAALGGGTGLPATLRAWKRLTSNITAIVTVSDDGGSSGRLREQLGMPPPGDIRNCLVALAEAETLMTELMQHRFANGSDLKGHSFGNLLIAALTDITGRFDAAVKESSKILRVFGSVIPVTTTPVSLIGYTRTGEVIRGESLLPAVGSKVERVELSPSNSEPNPEALEAIRNADVISIGPGSLYTSLLPVLIVPGIADAIRKSSARKILIFNIATQPGETRGYSAADHLEAIERHIGKNIFDLILFNSRVGTPPPDSVPFEFITTTEEEVMGIPVLRADLAQTEVPWRHDTEKLSIALSKVLNERSREKKTSNKNPNAALIQR